MFPQARSITRFSNSNMTKLENRRLSEPRTPQPFLPSWTARIGPLTERGDGLLCSHVRLQRALIDEFIVYLGSFQITVLPKAGEIRFDSAIRFKAESQCTLVWFRRMAMSYGTADRNTAAPECVCYGLGLEVAASVKVPYPKQYGYRLFAGGRMMDGLE